MKKYILKTMALAMAAIVIVLPACKDNSDHDHIFNQKNTAEQYLKTATTCTAPAFYYYSCECGEKGEQTFFVGRGHGHSFTAEIASDEYAIEKGDCIHAGTYYKSCIYCGEKGYDFNTFQTVVSNGHDFSQENPQGKYLYSEATQDASAVYYKSCICGKVGTETFVYGDALREYTEEEKIPYTPTSLTVTLYDTEKGVYGFTYNTQNRPLRPVLQVAEGDSFSDKYKEYDATVEEVSSYQTNGKGFTYYVVKTEVPMQGGKTYTYRAYDKYVDVGTSEVTIQTKDLTSTAFSFAHVSDSQMSDATGDTFGRLLSNVVEKNDFVLHTGDVVEQSKYESEWTNMLHGNFSYLSTIPMMAISGNHETTYLNGSNETYKHFHNKIPKQASTNLGYFYSFVYGNAKFIMLNTNDLTGQNQLKPEQYNWLVEELENNTSTWTFVSMHNPMYSVGKWGSNPEQNTIALAVREQLSEIFAAYGVDVVLQGHDHTISRTYPINAQGVATKETFATVDGVEYSVDPSGVIYVVNGPAGSQTREPHQAYDKSAYAYAKTSKPCSWADFSIDGNTLTVTVQYAGTSGIGQYEKWGIQKTA